MPRRVVRKAREFEPTTPPRKLKKKLQNKGFGSLNDRSDWMGMSLSGVQICPSHQQTFRRPIRFQQQQQQQQLHERKQRRTRPKRQIPTPPEPPLTLNLPHCARTGSLRFSDDEEDDDDDDFIMGGEMITPEKIESSINSLGSSSSPPIGSDSKDEVQGLSLAEYIYLDTLKSSHKKAKPLPSNHYSQPMMFSPPTSSNRKVRTSTTKKISVIGSIMRSDQKSRMQDAAFVTLMQTPAHRISSEKKMFLNSNVHNNEQKESTCRQ